DEAKRESEGLIATLGKLAYFLVFILFLPPVFDALKMQSVSDPIREMMTAVLNFIPRFFVVAVLVLLGLYLAKILGKLVTNLIKSMSAGKFNSYVHIVDNSKEGIDIPNALGWVVAVLIGLFFVVKARSV